MKPISPTMHGILDYLTCGFFLVIPSMFDLTGTFAGVCYTLAAGYILVSLVTNMPLGLLKWIPFWLHGRFEMVSGLVFIASPWIFGYAGNATMRNLFIAIGIVFLLVFSLTQWQPRRETVAEMQQG